jgi:hypothetical protein
MDKDDPEKRIAELERQLAERQRADADAGANWESPPAYTPYPPPPDAGQQAPPPLNDWQNPTQSAPTSYSPPSYSPGSYSYSPGPSRNQGGRIALILLFVGLPIVILAIAGIAVFSAFQHATGSLMPTPPGHFPVGGAGPSGSAPAGATALQTTDGLNGLLNQIRSRFGDTMGYELTVYADYAILDRADPQNSKHKKGYYYKGGSWSDFGGTEHVSSSDALVDLSKFDSAAVAAKLAGAGQALNVPNPTSTYLIVEGQEGGKARIAIYASGNGDSGYMDINPDGSVLQSHPQT